VPINYLKELYRRLDCDVSVPKIVVAARQSVTTNEDDAGGNEYYNGKGNCGHRKK
jgi:hypothetical protein